MSTYTINSVVYCHQREYQGRYIKEVQYWHIYIILSVTSRVTYVAPSEGARHAKKKRRSQKMIKFVIIENSNLIKDNYNMQRFFFWGRGGWDGICYYLVKAGALPLLAQHVLLVYRDKFCYHITLYIHCSMDNLHILPMFFFLSHIDFILLCTKGKFC